MRGILRRRRRRFSKPLIEGINGLHLKISILKASGLQGTDKLPVVSPYVVVRANHYRYSTHTADCNSGEDPEWNTDFSINLGGYTGKHGVSIKVWDKERFRKNYIGEILLGVDELFPGFKNYKETDPGCEPRWFPLHSLRPDAQGKTTGHLYIKFSLESKSNTASSSSNEDVSQLWQKLMVAMEGRDGLGSSFPGTFESLSLISGEDEDEDISSLNESAIEDIDIDDQDLLEEEDRDSDYDVETDMEIEEEDEEDYDASELDISEAVAQRMGKPESATAPVIQVTEPEKIKAASAAATARGTKTSSSRHGNGKRRSRKKTKKKPRHYEFNTKSNVVGMAFLDLIKVNDLPPERNVTRMGFDMDPFVVVSFGKKTFRTPWKRHTLNPVYNEKMLFPVQKHEQTFSINFNVLDKDRFSLNDFVADCDLSIQELLNTAPTPDPETGLYDPEDLESMPVQREPKKKKHARLRKMRSFRSFKSKNSSTPQTMPATPAESEGAGSSTSSLEQQQQQQKQSPELNTGENFQEFSLSSANASQQQLPIDVNEHREFVLPLKLKHKSKWEDKHNPEVIIRGRFLPYAALRQHFWRGLIRSYDIDDTEAISYIELTTMLDSLGSTLSKATKQSFFARFNRPLDEELTIDEVVICLEDQIIKDTFQQREKAENGEITEDESESVARDDQDSLKDHPVDGVADVVQVKELDHAGLSTGSLDSLSDDERNGRVSERIIQINTCPVCNQPRLGKRSEIDIVTHLATCASQNWAEVDTLVMDRYVNANHAKKRWYSKIVSKVSYGNYKLGANSANILVQDRVTGYVLEEKMNVYVRLGIRLLYRGIKSSKRMETKRIRALLRSMSYKQGRKYDSPSSVASIMPFIKFHNLYMDDILEPVENFKNFNEFFYRKLKPGARKCDAPDNAKIAVSPADCRTTMFDTVTKATEVWIKGREFSIKRLFGDAYPDMADKFVDGSLAIFRLAPQDYHRFHIPVNGVLGKPKTIEGEYYTVNPMAIRSALDVYGENVRVLVPIESEEFGTVMVVCVGAMMVGSTVITAKEGDRVNRLDELGYFQFGGSTLVVLFEPGRIKFDEDLVENSSGALETLVRVGMSIGHTPDEPEWERHDLKKPELASEEQKKWAHRLISGTQLGADDEKLINILNDF